MSAIGWYYGNPTFTDSEPSDLDQYEFVYSPLTEGVGNQVFPSRDWYAGIQDATGSETIEWSTTWIPVLPEAPAPYAGPTDSNLNGVLKVHTLGYGLQDGVLKIYATVNGTPLPGFLQWVTSTHDESYGNFAWTFENDSPTYTPETLPELLAPDGLCFLAAGNANTPDSMHDDIKPMLGHDIKRKVQTYAPQIRDVSAILEARDAYEVWEWFENVLDVGAEKFTARVAELGPNSKYWIARWVAPPQWEALHLGRYRLRGQLMLTGQGWADPPSTVTLAAEFGMDLIGSAEILAPVELEAEFEMALRAHNPFAVEFVLALEAYFPSFELREDGGFELREDGGFELRE